MLGLYKGCISIFPIENRKVLSSRSPKGRVGHRKKSNPCASQRCYIVLTLTHNNADFG